MYSDFIRLLYIPSVLYCIVLNMLHCLLPNRSKKKKQILQEGEGRKEGSSDVEKKKKKSEKNKVHFIT